LPRAQPTRTVNDDDCSGRAYADLRGWLRLCLRTALFAKINPKPYLEVPAFYFIFFYKKSDPYPGGCIKLKKKMKPRTGVSLKSREPANNGIN
jgi:hypothetical protein